MSRNPTLDLLRGCAVAGMLVANIFVFALPEFSTSLPQTTNPENVHASATDTPNYLVFIITQIGINQKAVAIFCLLFGFSLAMSFEKKTLRRTIKRNLLLYSIGVLHFAFLWEGDILTWYASCALLLYFLRHLSARMLATLGVLIFLLPAGHFAMLQHEISLAEPALHQTNDAFWELSEQDISEETGFYRGDYSSQVSYRWSLLAGVNDTQQNDVQANEKTTTTIEQRYQEAQSIDGIGRTLGMLLLGMAAYHFLKERPQWVSPRQRPGLKLLAWKCLATGLLLASANIGINHWLDWRGDFSLFAGQTLTIVSTLPLTAAYVLFTALWGTRQISSPLASSLQATGRLALTNYICQSLIASCIFYGFGLGMFNQLQRWEILFVALGVISLQMLFSSLWLRHFNSGPLESLVRGVVR